MKIGWPTDLLIVPKMERRLEVRILEYPVIRMKILTGLLLLSSLLPDIAGVMGLGCTL